MGFINTLNTSYVRLLIMLLFRLLWLLVLVMISGYVCSMNPHAIPNAQTKLREQAIDEVAKFLVNEYHLTNNSFSILEQKCSNIENLFPAKPGDKPLLSIAVEKNYPYVVEYLLFLGADPNLIAENQRTVPVIEAAKGNLVHILYLLGLRGAELHIRDKEHRTAMEYAEENNHADCITLMRYFGAKLLSQELRDEVFVVAAKYNIVSLLKQIDHPSDKAMNQALISAAQRDNIDCLIAIQSKDQRTLNLALKEAYRYDYFESIYVLLDSLDLEYRDENNKTALAYAIKERFWELAEILIERGANIKTAEDIIGRSLVYELIDEGIQDLGKMTLAESKPLEQWRALFNIIKNLYLRNCVSLSSSQSHCQLGEEKLSPYQYAKSKEEFILARLIAVFAPDDIGRPKDDELKKLASESFDKKMNEIEDVDWGYFGESQPCLNELSFALTNDKHKVLKRTSSQVIKKLNGLCSKNIKNQALRKRHTKGFRQNFLTLLRDRQLGSKNAAPLQRWEKEGWEIEAGGHDI